MMLPNGWKKVKLGDILTAVDYGTAAKSDAIGKYPVLRMGNLENGYLVWDDLVYSSSEEEYAKYELKKGDILFNRTNSRDKVGKTSIYRGERPSIFAGYLIRLKVNNECDPYYVNYCMNSKRFAEFCKSVRTDAIGQSNINAQVLQTYDFSLPPIEEQKKIAATLSVWDSAIEKMEKLIETKEFLLTEYGKELFGGTEQKQNENWSTIALSEVLNEHGDKSTGEEEVFSVSVHKGLVNQIEHLGRSFAAKDTSNYNRVHYGDIVYTKSPTGDFPLGIVKQSLIKEDVIVSPLYGVFTPQTFELGTILDFYFSSPINANNYLHPVAQKGAKNTINITNKKFLSAKLRLPIDVKEQKKIAQFVQTTKREMAVLQEILENYKKQKQGLMQKLLTGQWRVK